MNQNCKTVTLTDQECSTICNVIKKMLARDNVVLNNLSKITNSSVPVHLRKAYRSLIPKELRKLSDDEIKIKENEWKVLVETYKTLIDKVSSEANTKPD